VGNCATWSMGQQLLINRGVEAAIFEHNAESILGEGFVYDRCQIGVVTDMQMDKTLAAYFIHEPEQMHAVMRTQVDVVLPSGAAVLHAADPAVAELAPLCDGAVIFYALEPELPVIAAHCAQGGKALVFRDNRIVITSGADETTLFDITTLPSAINGKSPIQPLNVLAAASVALALDISPDLIRAGIETFASLPLPVGTENH